MTGDVGTLDVGGAVEQLLTGQIDDHGAAGDAAHALVLGVDVALVVHVVHGRVDDKDLILEQGACVVGEFLHNHVALVDNGLIVGVLPNDLLELVGADGVPAGLLVLDLAADFAFLEVLTLVVVSLLDEASVLVVQLEGNGTLLVGAASGDAVNAVIAFLVEVEVVVTDGHAVDHLGGDLTAADLVGAVAVGVLGEYLTELLGLVDSALIVGVAVLHRDQLVDTGTHAHGQREVGVAPLAVDVEEHGLGGLIQVIVCAIGGHRTGHIAVLLDAGNVVVRGDQGGVTHNGLRAGEMGAVRVLSVLVVEAVGAAGQLCQHDRTVGADSGLKHTQAAALGVIVGVQHRELKSSSM